MIRDAAYTAAEAAFAEYFVRNYPGPDTVIFDPKWHAPKLFSAAASAINAARTAQAFEGTVDGDTPLQAAAREAGWALMSLIDEIDFMKRDQLSDIIGRLSVALSAPTPQHNMDVHAGIFCAQVPPKAEMDGAA